jgi:hypothetical protein
MAIAVKLSYWPVNTMRKFSVLNCSALNVAASPVNSHVLVLRANRFGCKVIVTASEVEGRIAERRARLLLAQFLHC